MVVDIKDGWLRRIDKVNKTVSDVVANLDLHKEGANDRVRALASLVKEGSTDSRNLAAAEEAEASLEIEKLKLEAEAKKLEIEKLKLEGEAEKLKIEKDLNTEKLEIERSKAEIADKANQLEEVRGERMQKSEFFRMLAGLTAALFPAILTAVLELFKERKRDSRFKIANEYEETKGYYKTSSRKAVDEGLRDSTTKPSSGRWNIFGR